MADGGSTYGPQCTRTVVVHKGFTLFFLEAIQRRNDKEVPHLFAERGFVGGKLSSDTPSKDDILGIVSLTRALRRIAFLEQDQRSEIFLLAEREISHLLADNLLVKFKASAPYKELVHDEKLQEN